MSTDSIINPAAIQALRELSPDGDMEFLRELVTIYLADTPKHLAQLEDALGRQDVAVATRAAHTIKGSSGNVGAEQFSHMAHAIELACKSNNLAAAASSLPDLNKHFVLVTKALQQVVATS